MIEDHLNKKLANNLLQMYEKKINASNCKKCLESNFKKDLPSTFWYIGDHFEDKSKPRVAFVGKTTWGKWDNESTKNYYESFNHIKGDLKSEEVVCYDEVTEKSRKGVRFFTAIKNITKSLFNIEKSDCSFLEEIFITNLCKCNVVEKDKENKYINITPPEFFFNCKEIFEQEIMIIKPSHIVFFTNDYDDIVDSLNYGFRSEEIFEIFSGPQRFKDKFYPWEIKMFKNRENMMYSLRTRHPQGTYSEFEVAIKEWITNSFENVN